MRYINHLFLKILFVLIILASTANFALPLENNLSILDIANSVLDDRIVITGFNNPLNEYGIFLIEESHNIQEDNADAIFKLISNHKITDIALEGLYYEPPKRYNNVPKIGSFEWNILRFILRDKLVNGKISNAEENYLLFENAKLLKIENKSEYKIESPKDNNICNINDRLASIEGNLLYYRIFEEKLKSLQMINNIQFKNCLEYIEKKALFFEVAHIRSVTMSNNIAKYWLKHNKIIAIIGKAHTAEMTKLLRQNDVPYVVLATKNASSTRKPEPVIFSNDFNSELEEEFTTYFYLMRIKMGCRINSKYNSNVIKKFTHVDPKNVSFNQKNHTLSFSLHGRAFKKDIKDFILVNARIEKFLKCPLPASRKMDEQAVPLRLTAEDAGDLFIEKISNFIDSDEYNINSAKIKYDFVSKQQKQQKNRVSTETDWTDEILWEKVKNIGVIKQYSSALYNRPDYFIEGTDGNVVIEVKYIRNKHTMEYALDLVTNDQIERYIHDPYINAKKMIVLILIDKLKMNELGISTANNESQVTFEALIKKRIIEIESKVLKQGKKIELKIRFVINGTIIRKNNDAWCFV